MSRYSLIETLGYRPDQGLVRLDMHLERMSESSDELGFSFNRQKAHEALLEALATADKDTLLRLRMELSKTGAIDVQCAPFDPTPNGKRYTITSASSRLASDNPLIRHKTTERAIYQEARGEFPVDEIDEVLLLNERDEICEGTITNFFLRRNEAGPLLTPALDSGLLPGILRKELLQSGLAKEAVLTVGDLEAAHEFYVGNSLRGLIRANYVSLT